MEKEKISLNGFLMERKEFLKLYNDYLVRSELEPVEDFGNVLYLMYSEVGENEDWQVQVSYDLESEQMIVELWNKEETFIYKQHYLLCSFVTMDLKNTSVDWNDYYSWAHDIVEEKFSLDIEF